MAIKLEDHEAGKKFDGDYEAELELLRERLKRIQVAHIVRRKSAIILFEGWDASGKGGAINDLTADWDSRWFEVWPISAPTTEEKSRHFLWRFWQRLPGEGDIHIFDRSWYGRVLVERVEGFCTEAEWKRGYDEINEFEAQQAENGVTIVKIFMHVTQETQDKRLVARLEDPWKRWKTGADDYRNRARRADYWKAIHDMFDQTDTRWAPWKVVDANNKKSARIAVLKHVAEALERKIDLAPPEADPEVVALAEAALGVSIRIEGKSARQPRIPSRPKED